MVSYVDSKVSSKYPVVLTAQLDPGPSRWPYLVKWFLAIPPAPEPAGTWTGA